MESENHNEVVPEPVGEDETRDVEAHDEETHVEAQDGETQVEARDVETHVEARDVDKIQVLPMVALRDTVIFP